MIEWSEALILLRSDMRCLRIKFTQYLSFHLIEDDDYTKILTRSPKGLEVLNTVEPFGQMGLEE